MTDNLTLNGKQKRVVELSKEVLAMKRQAAEEEIERLAKLHPHLEVTYRITQAGHIELSCKARDR